MRETSHAGVMAIVLFVFVGLSAPGGVAAQAPSWREDAQRTQPRASDTTALSLASAVQRALAGQPGALSAEAGVRRAEASAAEVRATRLPRISIEAGGTRFQEAMIVAPLHGFNPMSPPAFDATLLQGRATATWLLFDGGVRGSRMDRSAASSSAAGAVRRQARQAVVEAAVRNYVGVGAARELLASHRALIDALDAERERATRMLAAGSVPRVAVLRADAALSRARAEESVRLAALRQTEADLARLIGSTLDSIATSAFQSLNVAARAAPPSREQAMAAAVSANPAVEQARAQHAAAQAGVDEARAAWWPTLALSGGYNGFGSGSGHGVAEWQTGLQVSYALFTGGARGAAVRRTDAERELARQAVRQAELDVASDVDRVLGDLGSARAQVDALSVAVEQFEAVVDVEALSLRAGAGVQSDYLRAVSDLLDARAALTRARAAEVGTRVTLARLMGELSYDWLVANLETSQ